MSLAAGLLCHWVRIEVPQDPPTQDPETGEILTPWVLFAEVWAEVIPQSAREFLAAAAEQSEVRGRMTIRYLDGVDATMRVIHRGKWYAIHGVMEDKVSGIEYQTIFTGEGLRLDQ